MRQAQCRFEYTNQCATRGTLRRFVTILYLDLGNFEVPVAELVPYEAVDLVGDVVKTVVGKAFGDIGFHTLELRRDPPVGLAEPHITMRTATHSALSLGVRLEATVVALAIH